MKVLVSALILFSGFANAASHDIKTMSQGKDGQIMVFDPPFLKVAKGDTINFIPTEPGHDVSSVAIPKGAKAWKGEVGKKVSTVVTEEGVYLYECPLHVSLAMVGVIQVGKPKNLKEVQASAKQLSAKFSMNKDRLDKYLAEVK